MGFYPGLMSGTSMGAIDASLVDFVASPLRIIATGATARPQIAPTRSWIHQTVIRRPPDFAA